MPFGSGKEWGKTFVGLMEKKNPTWRVYNSSVIAYTSEDYYNAAKKCLPLHDEVKELLLIFCLNDASYVSAKRIDQALEWMVERSYGIEIISLKR